MKAESLEKVDQFWRHELGMDSGDVLVPSQVCCTRQDLYSGLQLFRRGTRLVLAAPRARAEFVQKTIQGGSPDELFSVEWLRRLFGNEAETILGPAELNYADATSFCSERHDSARALSTLDSAAYQALATALDPKEKEDSGFSERGFPAFGAFSGNLLCAAASYEVWKPSIAHISVATHPTYRRRGFAKAAVQALATNAFEQGLILQWRAVAWNKNSLALARALGFEYYCSTIYVRFRESQ